MSRRLMAEMDVSETDGQNGYDGSLRVKSIVPVIVVPETDGQNGYDGSLRVKSIVPVIVEPETEGRD